MEINVKKFNKEAVIPEYKTSGAAGFDISSIEEVTINPVEVVKVPLEGEKLKEQEDKFVALTLNTIPKDVLETLFSTIGEDGLHAAILSKVPEGSFVEYVPLSHPVVVRTGLGFEIPEGYELEMRGRSGLAFKHDIHVFNGTIDSDYRGEVQVKMYNFGNAPITFPKGERIAQGVIKKVENAKFKPVAKLSTTDRGEKGFGSTGTK